MEGKQQYFSQILVTESEFRVANVENNCGFNRRVEHSITVPTPVTPTDAQV